jgi:phosphoglycerol transferase MdoB-like AlkP superfamily enzyme
MLSTLLIRLRRVSAVGFFVLAALAVFTLTRLILLGMTGWDQVEPSAWLPLFLMGWWFDLAVIACLVVPFCLFKALLPNGWRASRVAAVLSLIWTWWWLALLLFGALAELTFWLEFSTRFNFIAVDYLLYTHEVIGNIRESYPVGWLLTAVGLVALLLVFFFRRAVLAARWQGVAWYQRFGWLLAAIVLPIAAVSMTRLEQADSLKNAYAQELARNGIYTLGAALRRNELDYERFYAVLPEQKAIDVLQSTRASSSLVTSHGAAAALLQFTRRPRNVVLISVESLSASFVGAYGSKQGLTPHLDALARQSMLFENAFATGTRTVRGLEALSIGTPPIPGQAIVRRPGNEHLSTVGQLLHDRGYASYFVYGGYGYFDNMNAYFRANDYRIVDRTDFPSPGEAFENVWGVADEVLFDQSLPRLDDSFRRGQPFFAHIMTTSNHRPFTYPPGRIDIPSPGGRDGAVKYTDYAIGRFIERARSQPWFKDTLFVIVADHCASVAGKTRLPVDKYHIPLIFYAPALLPAGRYRPMVSQIDLPPTLLDAVGQPGRERFFGQSLLQQGKPPDRAFISNYQELGYLRAGLLTVLSPQRRITAFRVSPVSFESTPAEPDAAHVQEAIAYYQLAASRYKRGALKAKQPSGGVD